MRVTVNGEPRDLDGALSVAELLASLRLPAGRIAVEINEEVVPRDAYGERRVAGGDRIEIVHFVGGGCDDGPGGKSRTLTVRSRGCKVVMPDRTG